MEQQSPLHRFYAISCVWILLLVVPSQQQQQIEPFDPTEVESVRAMESHWGFTFYWDLSCGPPWNGDAIICFQCPQDYYQYYHPPCNITDLRIVSMNLSGDIPSQLFSLKELNYLDLSNNLFSGSIPKQIGNLSKLEHLDLSNNMLNGTIPEEIKKLSNLEYLNFSRNVLSGSIPKGLQQLSNIAYLDLGINNLSGPVPPELGSLSQLKFLSLSSNRLNDSLPKELGKLAVLQELYIESNWMSGEIPGELSNLTNLEILCASDNSFIGKLPEFLGNFTKLTRLQIQGTKLEGPIPNSLAALKTLETLKLDDLTNGGSSISFIKQMSYLSSLSLRNNHISGKILDQLGEFSNLTYLDLSFSNFSGEIPKSFEKSESLKFLYLGDNHLTGDVSSFIISPKLVVLDLSFNPISGSFPQDHINPRLKMNFLGTSIRANNQDDSKILGMLNCIQHLSCTSKALTYSSAPVSINCGGKAHESASGVDFYDDSEDLGAASFYMDTKHQWAVSNTGLNIFNPEASSIEATESEISEVEDPQLFKTARTSPNSLRYFFLGLNNGTYTVQLHFAEIVLLDDSGSWKGLGRRMFDVYIQDQIKLKDFNIQEEAKGSNRWIVRTFKAEVNASLLQIHFRWVGRGTCCIPHSGAFGPLVSAIQVSQGSADAPFPSDVPFLSEHDRLRDKGTVAGIVLASAAGVLILSSIFYLWWIKDTTGHIPLNTVSPR